MSCTSSSNEVSVKKPFQASIQNIKCVVVGDSGIGKSCLISTYTTNHFPRSTTDHYTPTVFEDHSAYVKIGDQVINAGIWDTAGQEDFVKLRPLSYRGADVFVICFSIASPPSFTNVSMKWAPELKQFANGVPKVLVGCKAEQRDDREARSRLSKMNMTPVTYDQGVLLADKIGAVQYMECSSINEEGVRLVFEQAIQVSLNNKFWEKIESDIAQQKTSEKRPETELSRSMIVEGKEEKKKKKKERKERKERKKERKMDAKEEKEEGKILKRRKSLTMFRPKEEDCTERRSRSYTVSGRKARKILAKLKKSS